LEALAVASDGRVFAGGQDKLIHAWDAEGKHVAMLEGHRDAVVGLALTADGKRLASVARDGKARLWDAAKGTLIAGTDHQAGAGLPALSADGALLAVGAGPGNLSVLR